MANQWACVLHLYYNHLTAELLEAAQASGGDLIITLPDGADVDSSSLPGRVMRVPNRGLDVGPFLLVLRDQLLDHGYEYILKIHSKRNDGWRKALIKSALAGREILEREPAVGMVGSRQYLTSDDGMNSDHLRKYHRELFGEFKADRRFIAGTIFACRTKPLRQFLTRERIDAIYAQMPEGYQWDGTCAHAFERLFGHMILAAGYLLHTV